MCRAAPSRSPGSIRAAAAGNGRNVRRSVWIDACSTVSSDLADADSTSLGRLPREVAVKSQSEGVESGSRQSAPDYAAIVMQSRAGRVIDVALAIAL
jgi:hypothetical protein